MRMAALCAQPARAALAEMATSGWELTVEARAHSELLPLSRWGDDDAADALGARGGQRGRNLAYIDNEIRFSRGSRIGAGLGRISLLARQSATLVASRGAIELAADAQTAGRPPADRRWDVHARNLALAGSGLAWQHGVSPAADWQLQGGAQALVLRDWRERLIDCTAGYTAADGRYAANLSSFEASDRLLFPYQQGVWRPWQRLAVRRRAALDERAFQCRPGCA